jgi:intracellular multiplication protein IcmD
MNKRLMIVMLYCFAGTAAAASLGTVSENVMIPMTGLAKIVHTISYVSGACFLVGALLQYKQHRDNPQQVRIGTPIAWALLGTTLIAIPFLSMMYSEAGQFAN